MKNIIKLVEDRIALLEYLILANKLTTEYWQQHSDLKKELLELKIYCENK
jgi:hypothetical protein